MYGYESKKAIENFLFLSSRHEARSLEAHGSKLTLLLTRRTGELRIATCMTLLHRVTLRGRLLAACPMGVGVDGRAEAISLLEADDDDARCHLLRGVVMVLPVLPFVGSDA